MIKFEVVILGFVFDLKVRLSGEFVWLVWVVCFEVLSFGVVG